MAIVVTVSKGSLTQILDIVNELRAQGLKQGVDFDFAYYPTQYDESGYSITVPAATTFTFYVDKYATLFTLKYLSN